jgi:hypothetical protein
MIQTWSKRNNDGQDDGLRASWTDIWFLICVCVSVLVVVVVDVVSYCCAGLGGLGRPKPLFVVSV